MLSTKKVTKRIKSYLIKKTTVIQSRLNKENNIEIEIELKNFLSYSGVVAKINNGADTLELNFKREKNRMIITIPFNYLSDHRNNTVTLSNGKKRFWLKAENIEDEDLNYFIIENKLYKISVNKKVSLKRILPDINFANQKKLIKNIEVSYNKLTAVFANEPISQNSEVKLYALKQGSIKPLEIVLNRKKSIIELLDFNSLSKGDWRLIITINDIAYFLQAEDEEIETLYTTNHQGHLFNKDEYLYLSMDNYYLNVQGVELEENADFVQLKVITDTEPNKYKYSLLIQDTKLNRESTYQIDILSNGFKVDILFEDLLEGSTFKRFFLVFEDQNEKIFKYQFFIENPRIFKKRSMKVIYNSQEYILRIYRRKDKSIGNMIVRRPKLRRLVKDLVDFKFSGFIGNLHVFKDCSFYLAVEDRNTFNMIEYPLDEENFVVQMQAEHLINVKGKEKSILDFFILVKDSEGKIIRKEKIKYEKADYRKDNYYEAICKKDQSGNIHYFLVTTTPFGNLKVETFMIPKDVDMLSNNAEKDENIWLIGERYNTAQDNGIALFRWLRKNTTVDAYYVIEDDAEDYHALEDKEYILTFGSKMHFEIASRAKVLLGTHDLENLLPYKPAKGFFSYEDTIKVFLQHGVLGRKPVEYDRKNYELPFDLFIVSSEPEKYDVVMNKMGYKEEEVAVTGLARFDNLSSENKPKDILLMPTWRDWIHTDEQFLKSQYYNYYHSLITNSKLQKILEKYNVNLNFYPHYRAQDFFAEDIQAENNRVNFVRLGSKTVQQLLVDHALLITDYSSVSFDFALMNKPVIYYHFDVNQFFKRGILRPIEETFLGKIARNESDIVDIIQESVESNFENFDIELDNIIKYQDHQNCERIYQAVLAKLNKEDERIEQ